MPFCVPRSSIIFQGHSVQNITDFDPNWALPDYRPVAAFKSLRFALFINSLGNSRNLWHYQWPAEFIKQRKPASKWHQIALYERWMFFLLLLLLLFGVFFGGGGWVFFFFFWWGVNNRIILKSMVLLLRHCKRKWSSYLNVKNRYLGMTGVTKKFHKSIAKLNYELNNNRKRCEG